MVRAKPIAGFGKVRVKDGCQYLQNGLLNQAVHYGGHPQYLFASPEFMDFDPAHGLRSVGTFKQFFPDTFHAARI